MDLLSSNTNAVKYIAGITALITLYCAFQGFEWYWWALAIFGYFLNGCCGISAMYHRKLTHKGYNTPKWIEYLFTFFAAMGGTGSSIGWVTLHRLHHRLSDKENDPHSPNKKHGIRDILTFAYAFKPNKWTVRDLMRDKFHLFLHKYYFGIMALWLSLLYLIDLKMFLFFGIIPMFILYSMSATSLILGHLHGYRTFNTPDKSTNSWIDALITWGEGWHNNHHRFPKNWNFKVKWWEFDPTAWIIRLIKVN